MRNRLREWRRRAGLTQQGLAERAGVTRQTVGGIEAGLYGPGVELALRLARALGCRVDDLFLLDDAIDLSVAGGCPGRVALAEIGGRTVARPLSGLRWAAHGVAERPGPDGTSRVRLLPDAAPALFLAGCDPALGLLAAHLTRGRREALWWPAGNAEAVAQLSRREVHAAAVHGEVEPEQPFPVARFRIARWELGWIVARGNPKGIRDAADLARPDVRLANREPGSGARALLDGLLAEAGVSPSRVRGYDRALRGHAEVAEAVALGATDVGIGLAAAALERDLDFIPVVAQACDLWLPADALAEPDSTALLEALSGAAFRLDLSACGPYDTSRTGERLA